MAKRSNCSNRSYSHNRSIISWSFCHTSVSRQSSSTTTSSSTVLSAKAASRETHHRPCMYLCFRKVFVMVFKMTSNTRMCCFQSRPFSPPISSSPPPFAPLARAESSSSISSITSHSAASTPTLGIHTGTKNLCINQVFVPNLPLLLSLCLHV